MPKSNLYMLLFTRLRHRGYTEKEAAISTEHEIREMRREIHSGVAAKTVLDDNGLEKEHLLDILL